MELASMLAGETFTDHPRSVSNVIGTLLRGYNDMVDDRRRQDLYRYGSKVVGTSADRSIELARTQRLLAWGDEIRQGRLGSRLRHRFRRPRVRLDPVLPEPAAIYALRGIRKITDEKHHALLGLLDTLIALGAPAHAAVPTRVEAAGNSGWADRPPCPSGPRAGGCSRSARPHQSGWGWAEQRRRGDHKDGEKTGRERICSGLD